MTVYRLIQSLRPEHEVTLLSLTDGTEVPEAHRVVADMGVQVHTVRIPRWRSWLQAWVGLLSSAPSQVSYYRSGRMRRLVQRITSEHRFDAIIVHMIRLVPLVQGVPHALKVLLLGDSMSLALRRAMAFAPPWRRVGMAWEAWRLSRLEMSATEDAAETWVFSDVDRADFAARGCPRVVRVPLSIDPALLGIPIAPPPTPPTAMFLGNLSVPHNVDGAGRLAVEVWPLVRARVPDARLVIAGADPVPSVRALAALPGVEVTGMVPDLMPLWRRAAVMIAPLRFATGVQTKVLEAMAAGIPVVTTQIVADGIGARPEQELLVGGTAQETAARAVDLMTSGDRFFELRMRARRLVGEAYTWTPVITRLERLSAEPPESPTITR